MLCHLSLVLFYASVFCSKGAELADVVNCRTGEILHQFSVGEFWKGFQSVRGK